MSLVSNFIGGISSSGLSGLNGLTQAFDLNDTTFSDLLEKQMDKKIQPTNEGLIGSLGMPAGLQIENFDGTEFSETAQDQMEAIGEKIQTEDNMSNPFDMNGDGQVTTSEAVTFFTSLLDSSKEGADSRSELFDFAKKQASDFYNKYSRNVVTDVKEFVDDIQGMIS